MLVLLAAHDEQCHGQVYTPSRAVCISTYLCASLRSGARKGGALIRTPGAAPRSRGELTMTVDCDQPNAIPACTTQPEYASSFSRFLPVLGPQIDALKRRLPALAGSQFNFHLISWRSAWKRNSAEPHEALSNGVHCEASIHLIPLVAVQIQGFASCRHLLTHVPRKVRDTPSLTFTRLRYDGGLEAPFLLYLHCRQHTATAPFEMPHYQLSYQSSPHCLLRIRTGLLSNAIYRKVAHSLPPTLRY